MGNNVSTYRVDQTFISVCIRLMCGCIDKIKPLRVSPERLIDNP
jgi:hypothetical protein